jgi:HSP20 family molecular chaperone IbpA
MLRLHSYLTPHECVARPRPRGPLAPPQTGALYDDQDVADFAQQGLNDLADDARQLLLAIDQQVPGAAAVTADCRPPVDVIETATSLEIVMDIPGVPPESIRVVVRRDTLLIVGAKLSAAQQSQTRFHLAERSYGRFARAIRLSGAFETSRARATVRLGQLRIALPRLDDRRGGLLQIPVERA